MNASSFFLFRKWTNIQISPSFTRRKKSCASICTPGRAARSSWSWPPKLNCGRKSKNGWKAQMGLPSLGGLLDWHSLLRRM